MISFDRYINQNDFQISICSFGEERDSFTMKELEEDKNTETKINYYEDDLKYNPVIYSEENASNIKEQPTEEQTRPSGKLLFATDKKDNNQPVEQGKKPQKKKNSSGRRKKSEKIEGKEYKHNKFSDDNIRRKIKSLLINYLRIFVNYQISQRVPSPQKILTPNQSQIFNAKIEYNQQFLNKTLEEIFSEKRSERYSTFNPDYNKNVIYNLMNTGDEGKKEYFRKLLKLTFIQCLNHFIKIERIDELNGMKLFEDLIDEIKEKNDGDDNYIEVLSYYMKNYAVIINNKKPRPKKDNF